MSQIEIRFLSPGWESWDAQAQEFKPAQNEEIVTDERWFRKGDKQLVAGCESGIVTEIGGICFIDGDNGIREIEGEPLARKGQKLLFRTQAKIDLRPGSSVNVEIGGKVDVNVRHR